MKPFFVIIGTQTPGGATLSVAPDAFNVEVEVMHNYSSSYGEASQRSEQRGHYVQNLDYLSRRDINDSLLSIRAESRTSRFYHVDAQSYPEAWQQLFDLWVPPDFTKQTASQILSHFTLNAAQI